MRVPGTTIGRYELVRPLGRGAMGEVWEALLHGPSGFRKAVALKLLREGPPDRVAEGALVREARIGGMLHHPNVVAVLDVGREQGAWYVAMELVRGASLGELARGRRLPPGVVLDVGVQVAAALRHVHELAVDGQPAGLVHRDVKPHNVMADPSGVVKLADLGIAAARGADAAGTPGFMPPEQARGAAEPASDLFALGVSLHVLATAARPFGGRAPARLRVDQLEAWLATPEALAPVDAAVPGLGPVLYGCLRGDPAERFPSAAALGAALARLPRPSVGPSLLGLLAAARPDLDVPTHPPETPRTWRTPSPGAAAQTVVLGGNLPPSRDRFHGRPEVDELCARIRARSGPVVLVGTGGAGKTRMALESARRLQPEHPGGAWFLDLSEARSAPGVCSATARALGLDLGSDPVAQVGHALAGKGPALFLFDNLEQCVAELADTLARWIPMAPEAAFLGTSRVPPGLPGERVVAVGPLPTEHAVALLVDRAPRPIRPDERPEATALVEALEGLPLAIELAAARLKLLPLAQVRARLGSALEVLAGGGTERPERHRSLSASLAWSYDLLSPPARAALARASVFEGGFRLGGALAVLGGPDGPGAVDLALELVDASLLRVDPSGRFWLPVVVRAWAASKLTDEERRDAERRHGLHHSRLGDALDAALLNPTGAEVFHALAEDLDNLVSACRRAVAGGDAEVAARTALAAWTLLDRVGPVQTGAQLLEAARSVPGLDRGLSARVAAAAGLALRELGQVDAAAARLEEAVAVHRDDGNRADEGAALGNLAVVRAAQQRHAEARETYHAALALHRALGQRRWEGIVLGNLGNTWRALGDLAQARACHEAALAIHREVGNRRSEGVVLSSLGFCAMQEERWQDARTWYEQAIAALHEVGHRRLEAIAVGNLAMSTHGLGRIADARAAFEATLALHRAIGNRRSEGVTLGNLALLDADAGDLDHAWTTMERSLAISRELRDGRAASVLRELGEIHLALDQPAAAAACFAEARGGGLDPAGEAACLAGLGRASWASGDRAGALRALEESAAALRTSAGTPLGVVLAALAEARLAAGDADAARRAADEAEPLLAVTGAERELWVVRAVRARLGDARVAAEVAAEARRLGLAPGSPLGRRIAPS